MITFTMKVFALKKLLLYLDRRPWLRMENYPEAS